MTAAPTTPESILARFAAEYAEHKGGRERRLRIEFDDRPAATGYVVKRPNFDQYLVLNMRGDMKGYTHPEHITRIDYSNARYRGPEPLYVREEG